MATEKAVGAAIPGTAPECKAGGALDLKRAMILIGGLDEEVAQRILDQEGT